MALPKTYRNAERPKAIVPQAIAALGIVSPPPIQVQFPIFSGSLAQLFTLVKEHKLDLLDVPLLPICEAYFQYLLNQETPNLDESAAALAALSYLLERKAWMLLPLPEEPPEEFEPLELVERTIHEYFSAIDFLRNSFEDRSLLFFRTANSESAYELPFKIESLEISALANALQAALLRNRPKEIKSVTRIGRSLAAEMILALKRVTKDWQDFLTLLTEQSTREDAVYLFLSLLELMPLGQVQSRVHGEVVEFSRA